MRVLIWITVAIVVAVLLLGCDASTGGAATHVPVRGMTERPLPVVDAARPHVFMYGDSIRQGYEQGVRRRAASAWVVWTTGTLNGGGSVAMLASLDLFLVNADVYYINAGLWDVVGETTDRAYALNIDAAVQECFIVADDTIVVVAATAPVDDAVFTGGENNRIEELNDIARDVVALHQAEGRAVFFDDLHAFVLADGMTQFDGTHYNVADSDRIAAHVYLSILSSIRYGCPSCGPNDPGGR